ncbi:glycosyltransferase family 4 protein [Priestia megaterium]|uniref:Glycosyltransferase family 4 protein n=1 Tax=Priestia megaterium TaxID=1404 RepID=A0A6H1NWG8_PRIMG|nr:glycosyltransferase [Priestia megaterium]QIZ05644.1 glycosyltransferase family 4 protein [Priestia megaterium]
MKIAIVIWRMAFSGAENVANALIQEFISSGHEVEVILTASKVEASTDFKVHSVAIDGPQGIRQIKRSILLRKIVKENNYDVVIGFGHIDAIHVLRALPFVNTTTIACARMDPLTYPENKRLRIERKLMYRMVDGMILQTNSQKEYFKKIVKGPTVVIPNPVRDFGIKSVCVAERENKCVTVARLDDAQKDHMFMFECFREFVKIHPDYILELYGDGPDKQKYENYINQHGLEGKIVLCGRVNNPQEHIKNAKMFLLTSRHEGMPNALIEAMAMGLPCVAVDCGGGGVKDLVRNNENGIIVEQGDLQTFVYEMCRVADDNVLQERLSAGAIQIRAELSLKAIAHRWIEAFKKIRKGKIDYD